MPDTTFVGIATVKWAGGSPSWPVCEPVAFSLPAFAGSLVWISLSYSGFNAAVYVAGEARDPSRTVPAAMLRATVAVVVIYLALNLVFVGFVPCEDVVGRPDVAFAAASSLLGDPGAQIVRAIVALALLLLLLLGLLDQPVPVGQALQQGLQWLATAHRCVPVLLAQLSAPVVHGEGEMSIVGVRQFH